MMAQEEFHYPMYVQNTSYIFSIFFGWFFVIYLDWGIFGLSMIRNCCDLIALIMIFFILKRKYWNSRTIVSFQKRSLNKLLIYLKLGIPMGIVTYLEWGFFEIQAILIGLTHNTEALAAHSSFCGVLLFFFMLPSGVAMSINSFLGNLVGEDKL